MLKFLKKKSRIFSLDSDSQPKVKVDNTVVKTSLECKNLADNSDDSFLPIQVTQSVLQLRKVYGLDKLGTTGKGQTVVVYGFNIDEKFVMDSYIGFDQFYGFNRPNNLEIKFVTPNQTPIYGYQGEAIGDIQDVHAMAPDAKIILISIDTNLFSELFPLLSVGIQYSLSFKPDIVSMSLGWAEEDIYYINYGPNGGIPSTDPSFNPSLPFDQLNYKYFHTSTGVDGSERVFEKGVKDGIVFVASSGDEGALPNYPSTSPNVIAAGATLLTTLANGKYLEYGASWSGGGPSTWSDKPEYQKHITGKFRMTPDLSAIGELVWVYLAASETYGIPYPIFSPGVGTSVSAPIWAGIIASLNEARLKNSLQKFNTKTLLSEIYLNKQVQNKFYDITKVTNLISGLAGYTINNGSFTGDPNHWNYGNLARFVEKGWDMASGWGTPRHKLLEILSGCEPCHKKKEHKSDCDHKTNTVSSFISTLSPISPRYVDSDDTNPQGIVFTRYQGIIISNYNDPSGNIGAGSSIALNFRSANFFGNLGEYYQFTDPIGNPIPTGLSNALALLPGDIVVCGSIPVVAGVPQAGSLYFFASNSVLQTADVLADSPPDPFSILGSLLNTFTSPLLNGPNGIAVNSKDPLNPILFVTNRLTGTVVRIDLSLGINDKTGQGYSVNVKNINTISTGFGVNGNYGPTGITLYKKRLYVADTVNNAIQVIDNIYDQTSYPITYMTLVSGGSLNGPYGLTSKTPTKTLICTNIDYNGASSILPNSIVEFDPMTGSVLNSLQVTSIDPVGSLSGIVATNDFKRTGTAALLILNTNEDTINFFKSTIPIPFKLR